MNESTKLFKNRITERLITARLDCDEDKPLSENTGKRILQRLERTEAKVEIVNAVFNQILFTRCREEQRRVS